jgi:putative membrane protein
MKKTGMQCSKTTLIGSVVLVGLLVSSGIRPFDRITWILEVFPILIVLPVLWATCRCYPLTNLLYLCIFLHAIVLMVGGAYSYARVPLGFQIADLFHLTRNPYDKIGHFFQGFVPALAAREIFVRGQYVQGRRMLAFLAVCVVLAISATYELIEWAAAVALGQGADEFLGTQGDPWDTQSDMLFALIGGIVAMLFLSRLHDRQLVRMPACCSDPLRSLNSGPGCDTVMVKRGD